MTVSPTGEDVCFSKGDSTGKFGRVTIPTRLLGTPHEIPASQLRYGARAEGGASWRIPPRPTSQDAGSPLGPVSVLAREARDKSNHSNQLVELMATAVSICDRMHRFAERVGSSEVEVGGGDDTETRAARYADQLLSQEQIGDIVDDLAECYPDPIELDSVYGFLIRGLSIATRLGDLRDSSPERAASAWYLPDEVYIGDILVTKESLRHPHYLAFPLDEPWRSMAGNGEYFHPHVGEGETICLGAVEGDVANDPIGAIDLIPHVLSSWNPASEYIPLEGLYKAYEGSLQTLECCGFAIPESIANDEFLLSRGGARVVGEPIADRLTLLDGINKLTHASGMPQARVIATIRDTVRALGGTMRQFAGGFRGNLLQRQGSALPSSCDVVCPPCATSRGAVGGEVDRGSAGCARFGCNEYAEGASGYCSSLCRDRWLRIAARTCSSCGRGAAIGWKLRIAEITAYAVTGSTGDTRVLCLACESRIERGSHEYSAYMGEVNNVQANG